MKLKKILFIIAFLLISAAYFFGSENQAFLNQSLFLIFPLFAALAGILATRVYGLKSITGKSLLAMTLGFACWAIGEILWYVFKNILNINPFPSMADVFFLLGYPLVLLGLYMEFGKAQIKLQETKKSLIILGVLLALALAGIVAYFGIYMAYDPSVGFLENAVAMSYGAADLILIVSSFFALLMAHTYRGGKFSTFWIANILGFLLFLTADILFAIYNVPYTDNTKPYIYIDLLWIAGYMFLAYGMLDYYSHIYDIKGKIEKQRNQ